MIVSVEPIKSDAVYPHLLSGPKDLKSSFVAAVAELPDTALVNITGTSSPGRQSPFKSGENALQSVSRAPDALNMLTAQTKRTSDGRIFTLSSIPLRQPSRNSVNKSFFEKSTITDATHIINGIAPDIISLTFLTNM